MIAPFMIATEVAPRDVTGDLVVRGTSRDARARWIRVAGWLHRTTKSAVSQGLSRAVALGLVVATVSGCVADPVFVQAPDEQGLRPRRLFVLLAVGTDVVPRDGAATTRAWRALGDELQVRGFDLIALAAPRSRLRKTDMDTLAIEVERALREVDLEAYDELVLVSAPAGACVWSMLRARGVLDDTIDAKLSLHVELQPAWVVRGGARHVRSNAERCAEDLDPAMPAVKRLQVRLLGRSPRVGTSNTNADPTQASSPRTLDVALDARAFGRDLVLLIDELFETRDGDTPPKPDLRRVTR